MRRLAFLTTIAAASLAASLALAAPPYQPAHLSNGAPDLEGQWTNESSTRLERDTKFGNRLVMTPQEETAQNKANSWGVVQGFTGSIIDPGTLASVMHVDGKPRTSLITTTPDGRIPYIKRPAPVTLAPLPTDPAAIAALIRRGHENPEQSSAADRCLGSFGAQAAPVMMPGFQNDNYQIVQSKDSVAIMIEMMHDVRVVRLNQPHRKDGVRPLMGDSIGHYDGDTLVVETTNFPKAEALRGAWEKLKVTERFTRVGSDRILYRFTVEDPTVFKQAWGGEYEFHPSRGPIYEYACHEGDRTLEGVLAGARYEEGQLTASAPGGDTQNR